MGITDPNEEYFKDGTWGWDGTQWRKLPMVWGYSDRYTDKIEDTDAAAGDVTVYSSTVPAGEVWVVTVISAIDVNSALDVVGVSFHDGTDVLTVHQENTLVANQMVTWSGVLYMKAGDRVRVKFEGCTLHDYLAVMIMGYKMKVV